MIRLSCSIANFNDGTSFYRGHGVMSEIHKSDRDFRVDYITEPDIVKIKGIDVLFVQRPDQIRDITLIQIAKKLNIPIVLDYDDYLLDVPVHNRYHKIMDIAGNPYQDHVKNALSMADLVFVSTDEIKKKLYKYNDNIHVIRNAFDDYIYKASTGYNCTKTVLWRGSSTHEKDLELYRDQITALVKANPDFRFIFLIDKFFDWLKELKATNKNVELLKAVQVFEYFYLLQSLRVGAVIVPLEDCLFNHCKSDVASLEATSVGAFSVAPDWAEWKELTTHTYKEPAEFTTQTQAVIDLIKSGVGKSHKLPKVRLLSEANKQRAILIKTLVG
jgi:glycosyltransferase involved in cell wall biosynthesis